MKYVLAPREATEDMLVAGCKANMNPPTQSDGSVSVYEQIKHIYDSMLSARPAAVLDMEELRAVFEETLPEYCNNKISEYGNYEAPLLDNDWKAWQACAQALFDKLNEGAK